MRNLSDEEKKKLYQDLLDEIYKVWNHNSYTNIPSNFPSIPTFGISPTDIEAKGKFAYHEPEVDEQGTYYGYKILHRHCDYCSTLLSPRYPAAWQNGELHANHEPSERTMFGIHFTKRPDHPELRNYANADNYCLRNGMYGYEQREWVLVKCALSGTIVETEQGFRAQHATIIGVYQNGHWQSYQDYSRRSTAYSYPTPQEEWEYRIKTRKGNERHTWDFNSPWNPNP